MERLRAFWNRGWFAKAILSIVGVLIICCVIGILVPRRPRTPTATAPTAQQPTPAEQAPTAAPVPTSAPAPTDVPTDPPAPTDAPVPTAAPAPTAPPSIAAVGDRVEVNGTALTVVKVDQVKEVGSFQKAKDGNVFVLAEVLIENVAENEIPYNPLYFKVKDADGFEYNAGISMADQSLKSGKLMKGDKARGSVLFEVKEGAVGLVLQYKPLILFSSDEVIRIALN